jgi:hypothetical protein
MDIVRKLKAEGIEFCADNVEDWKKTNLKTLKPSYIKSKKERKLFTSFEEAEQIKEELISKGIEVQLIS